MRFIILAVTLCATLAGCASSVPGPSVLQRYEDMSSTLRSVTQESGQAASDERTLGARMQAEDMPGSRRQAVVLKYDAVHLSTLSVAIATSIRSLSAHERNRIRRRFFGLVLASLSHLCAEGRALASIADLVWSDPLVESARDQKRRAGMNLGAQWDAWEGLVSARQAEAWRASNRRAFRFVVRIPGWKPSIT